MAFRFHLRKRQHSICEDNIIFQLHYRFTVWFLLILCFILAIIHFTKENVECFDRDEETTKFCWNFGDLTKKSELSPRKRFEDPTEKEYVKINQLIFFKMILIAVWFYGPRFLWMLWDGGRIRRLASDLNQCNGDDSLHQQTLFMTARYVQGNEVSHIVDLVAFGLCEVLNFINALVQMSLLDTYLENIFSTHGLDVISLTSESERTRNDTLIEVFPRQADCIFAKPGPSGNAQSFTSKCIFPNNSFNEKVFVLVLVWFLILSVLSGLVCVYRVLTLVPFIRQHILGWRCRHVPPKHLTRATRNVGSWFILYRLSKNVGVRAFAELIEELAKTGSKQSNEEIALNPQGNAT